MGIPESLIILQKNLYNKQKVRNKFGETKLFRIWKAVRQRCILSPHLLSLHSEYIIQMVGLEEMTAGTKIGGGNSLTVYLCKQYHIVN